MDRCANGSGDSGIAGSLAVGYSIANSTITLAGPQLDVDGNVLVEAAIGDSGMWALNHADRSMPSFLDSPVPPIVVPGGGGEPALVGAGAPVINIGEIKADAGIDVQTEVMWALRRADRIKRERG